MKYIFCFLLVTFSLTCKASTEPDTIVHDIIIYGDYDDVSEEAAKDKNFVKVMSYYHSFRFKLDIVYKGDANVDGKEKKDVTIVRITCICE